MGQLVTARVDDRKPQNQTPSATLLPVYRWPGQGRPAEVEAMLREMAFVFHATERVRAAIRGESGR